MRYYYDTEFYERGPRYPIEMISLGIVSEDNRKLYLVNSGFDWANCDSLWLHENVLPYVGKHIACDPAKHEWGPGREPGVLYHNEAIVHMPRILKKFIGDDIPEFWAYYADYDHVVMCQLFGTMINLPKKWPMYTNDLKQLVGDKTLPKPEMEHNALLDAIWVRKMHKKILLGEI